MRRVDDEATHPMGPMADELALARGAVADGREAIALEHLGRVAEESPEARERLIAVAGAAEVNLRLGRPHEALTWVDRLREEAPASDEADLLEAVARLRTGEPAEALRLAEQVAERRRPSPGRRCSASPAAEQLHEVHRDRRQDA